MAQARGSVERRAETRAEAAELAEDIDNLPLALAIARAHSWGMNWTFAQYRKHLSGMIAREPTRAVDYPRSIAATFALAIDKAKSTSPEAEQLLGLAAFLAPNLIPLVIIPSDLLSEVELGEAVAALAEVSLVTRETLDDGSPGISVHRLVQEVTRLRLAKRAGELAALAIRLVADAYPRGAIGPDDVRSWSACRRLEGHAAKVLEHAPDTGEAATKTALLLNQYALHLSARAEYAAAEPLYRRALAITEKNYGSERPEVATSLNNLARLLNDTNRLAEAEPMYRRALTIDEKSLGPEDANVAVDLNNLALLLQETNRLAEAESMSRRALAITEKNYGPEHPTVATRLNNLAQLLKVTHRLAEAEPLYCRALAIAEKNYGPEHPSVAIHLNNLAQLLTETYRLAEAEPMMRRALAIDEKSLDPEDPDFAIHLNNLAGLLQAANRPAEAQPVMSRALTIIEKSLGPHHPNTRAARENYAAICSALGVSAERTGDARDQSESRNRPVPVSIARQKPSCR